MPCAALHVEPGVLCTCFRGAFTENVALSSACRADTSLLCFFYVLHVKHVELGLLAASS